MEPNSNGRFKETQNIYYTLQSTGDNEIDGPLIYRNVTDLYQDNWRNQHNYKETTSSWEQLPYECRIDWTPEGTEILKHISLDYIRSQSDDNMYNTDVSSAGTQVAPAVVYKKEKIIIRLNDSASVQDAKMTAIRIAVENASETREKLTIHRDSLTSVIILNNRKEDLSTMTRAIRDAASRLTQRPTTNWIRSHTVIPGKKNADQAANRGLQLDIINTTVNASTFREQ